GARPLPRRARVGGPRAAPHPGAAAQLFVVVLPRLLAAEGPGAAARSHVGLARAGAADPRAPRGRGNAQVGAALGPRAAGHGVRTLSGDGPSPSRRVAQAIDALRHGWPLA